MRKRVPPQGWIEHRRAADLSPIYCMIRVALLFALLFVIPTSQAVAPAPRMTGERMIKQLERVEPEAVPWKPGSTVSREELAYLHSVITIEYLQGYVAALYDATEGKAWCYNAKYKNPKPDTFWDESRWGLHRLPPEQLKRNAAELLVEIWREKWPCPPSPRGRRK